MDTELDLDLLSSLDYTPLLSPGNHPNGHQLLSTAALSPLSSPAMPFRKRRESSSTHLSNKRSKTPSTTPLLSSVFDFLPDIDLQLPPPPNIDSIKKHSSVLINPNHMRSTNSSPLILPSSYPLPSSIPNLDHNNNNNNNTSNNSNTSNSITTTTTSTTTSTTNNNNNNSTSNPQSTIGTSILSRQNSRTSIPGDKKMTHKLAEQGRRNRMNVALQDLDKLIPDDYKRDILVPSKATTVELGSQYIKDLQLEIQKLKSISNH